MFPLSWSDSQSMQAYIKKHDSLLFMQRQQEEIDKILWANTSMIMRTFPCDVSFPGLQILKMLRLTFCEFFWNMQAQDSLLHCTPM